MSTDSGNDGTGQDAKREDQDAEPAATPSEPATDLASPPGADDDDDGDVELKVQGPIRRNAPLIIGILIVMAIGPSVSSLIEAYRGIVLRLDDDKMLVAFEGRAPKNVDPIAAKAGDIVLKERLSWSPRVVPRVTADYQLAALHARFVKQYSGVIVLINPPKVPSGPHTAIIQLDSGKKLNVPLYGEHLATAQVGSRVRKEPEMWEPILVPEDELPPPGPSPTPEATPPPDTTPTPGPTPAPEGAPGSPAP